MCPEFERRESKGSKTHILCPLRDCYRKNKTTQNLVGVDPDPLSHTDTPTSSPVKWK